MRSMTIHFDVERILDSSTDLELEFYDFLKKDESHTLQRWLLTLSLEEVEELYNDLANISKHASRLIPLSVIARDGGEPVDYKEYDKMYREYMSSIALISNVKKGFATYKMAEDDMDWKFTITEEGKKEVESMMKLLNDS